MGVRCGPRPPGRWVETFGFTVLDVPRGLIDIRYFDHADQLCYEAPIE